jgi:membrane protein required for colicin V production
MVFAVDLGLAFVLFLSLIAGLRNGFLDTLISIAAWLGSLLVAVYLSEPILVRLPEWARSVPGAGVVLGVLLFLISFAAIRLIGHAAGAGEHEATDAGDRALGAVVGAARGLLLAASVACFLVAFLPPQGRVMRESRALPLLAPAGRAVSTLAPSWLRERMVDGWARLESGEGKVAVTPNVTT